MAIESTAMSDLPIPPGEYLAEVIGELGMNQAELAQRMGRPVQAISEIMSGGKAIVPETALQLERVTSVPAHVWTGLESQYRLLLARHQDERHIESQAALVADFPYKELAKLGWVSETRKVVERVRELCRFFGVDSLEQVQAVDDYAPAFRAGAGKASGNALAAWLRMAALQAMRIETEPLDRRKLQSAMPELRKLTLAEPGVFLPKLRELLAGLGVALVIQPHLPKTYVHGATFWLMPDKAVIVMTIRGKWADVFWFSLFHELAHVLKHGKRETFLEDGKPTRERAELEREADAFAGEALIPAAAYSVFAVAGDFSMAAIGRFAASIQIDPGIVTGRLRHDRRLPLTIHVHRTRYEWVAGISPDA
jgi:HTH-type transcriptional regulator/antitoxin HigA